MSCKCFRILAHLAGKLVAGPVLAGASGSRVDVDKATASVDTALARAFRDPPAAVRPRVWWHWMNGNITREGIARDLAWMKSVGIGGVQNFDAHLQTPQVVDQPLAYMTPEWQDAFRFAVQEAERQGLEFAIASSPGWSETGGPWVAPRDGMKKLVWSSATLASGQRLRGALPALPATTGPFQGLHPARSIEEMIAGQSAPEGPHCTGSGPVLAYPVADVPALPLAQAHDGLGNALDAAALGNADSGAGVTLARKDGTPPLLRLDYPGAVTIRSATLFLPDVVVPFSGSPFVAALETSRDGSTWSKLTDLTLGGVPTTASFPAVTAAHFRVVLHSAPCPGGLATPVPGSALGGLLDGIGAAMANKPLVVGTFVLDPQARVDRFETKAGFVTSPDYYALGSVGDAARGIAAARVIDLTDRMQADGTLDWTAPKLPRGWHWQVLRLGWSLLGTTNHPAAPEATGLEVDKYDGQAVQAYLDHYLDLYRQTVGDDLIGRHGIRALLIDSIEAGAANWTPQLIARFRSLRGYDPTPWLPALTGVLVGSREDSDRFLYDYRRTLADLLASEHYGTIARVAHANGLRVYAEALESHRPMLGDDMTMRRHADVPMAAMWFFSKKQGPRQTLVADDRGAASVAHLYGQNLVAAESMTSSMAPWAFAPGDLKHVIDLEFVNGVNLPVVHTSVHVPVEDRKPGLSLFIFGQYFNRMETWSDMAKPWIDYIARSSLLLQQGRNVADVAYFHGEEAPLTSLYGDRPVADAPITHAYDFLNFDALTTLLGNDGADVVTPAGARYRAIYLGGSSPRMTLAALRRLAALVQGGATLIGTRPQGSPSLVGAEHDAAGQWQTLADTLWPGTVQTHVGKGTVIASHDVERALQAIGVAPDLRFTGADAGARIPFVHRRDEQGDIYYLCNPGARPQTIEAHFRVTGKRPELWHPETGRTESVSYRIAAGETVVPLSLGADDAVFVVFRGYATAVSFTAPAQVLRPLAGDLDSGWTMAFQPDRGAPATASLPKLASLSENPDPGIRYFSGVVTYSRRFTVAAGHRPGAPLWLDLGEVGDLAQVRVNGVSVGTVWHAPYRLDIGGAVNRGVNTLEVQVADTWVNRLIGDAQPGARPITWTAMPTYRADAPLRRSGLIGPVRLWEEGK